MSLKSKKESHRKDASFISRWSFIVVMAVSLSTQQAQTCSGDTWQGPDQAFQEVRFAVAHQLLFSWCYGYLYVSADKVRYEVSQPESCRSHSFEAPRTQVTVRQWTILGRPQDAIELKVNGTTYHMRWLANEAQVNTGSAKRMSPPLSAAPATLIAAIQNPASLVAQNPPASNAGVGGNMPGSMVPTNANPASGANSIFSTSTPSSTSSTSSTSSITSNSAETTHELPPGTLQGIYVCQAGEDARPTNKQFIFYPDGFMMNGLPQEGLLDFDFDHYRSENNRNKNWVGRYKVEGEKIKIVWQNEWGDPANPVVVKRNEAKAHPVVDVGWEVCIPTCRCTGKRFSGKYVWGPPAADQYLQFFPDGTFLDHRVTDQLIVPSHFYEHPRVQRGTYSIQNQTLIFTFADGHRGTRTFLAPKVQENDTMFDWISLGWQLLFEDHYRAELAR